MEKNHQENQGKRRDKDHRESDGGERPPWNNPAAERKEHVCTVCRRRFVSGKALGGHVSAHVQAKKAKNIKNGSLLEEVIEDGGEEIIIQEDDDNDDEIHVCFICGKQFPSNKSLYGHMRSHPDRAWRGMGRPPHPPRAVVDLQGRLEHWGTTDKRGRAKKWYNVGAFGYLLEVVKEETRRLKRAGEFGSKKKTNDASSRVEMEKEKTRHRVSENPRFGRVDRSSSCKSEDTDEYYCKNHVEETRIHGGILNPKEIPRKTNNATSYQKKESLEAEPESKKTRSNGLPPMVNRRVESRQRGGAAETPTAAGRTRKILRIDLNEMPADSSSANGSNGGT